MPQAQARAQMGDQFRLHFLSPVGLSPGPFLAGIFLLAGPAAASLPHVPVA